MAGNDERQHVGSIGAADGARAFRQAEALSHFAVTPRMARGYETELRPNPALELRTHRGKLDGEIRPVAGKILAQLLHHVIESRMVARHDHALQPLAQHHEFALES